MDQHQSDTPEVLRFAPQQKRPDESDPIDTVGHALVAMLQEAATLSKENADRAMAVAHKLSIQLRAAEDRIKELEGEIERLESRATRAEGWLQTIKTEIQDRLIGPIEANRPERPALHERDPFEATVEQRKAQVASAEATLANATQQFSGHRR
jgi:chromosome segregation ATPase